MYCGYITTLKNVRSHPNADRMKLADCFGNTVCVGLDAAEGETVVYFPTDGQLSIEFCRVHDLVRRKDENGNPAGGYLEPDKRNIRAIKLRGEKSDGLVMPLSCLAYTGVNLDEIKVGDQITTINGHEICCKYIPRSNSSNRRHQGGGNRTRKVKVPTAPLFSEHADTEQLAYNLGAFKTGDEIEITLKMHGTSQRTGYLPVLQGYKRSLWDRICGRTGSPIYDWGYVSGTRRVVLDNYEGGFYGSNAFREQHSKTFEGKLHKGETVYYEVTSFTDIGVPIMGSAAVPKEAQKEYGKEMIFHYGLAEGSDMYVYRMTLTTEEGFVIDYSPDFMRYRCDQMGVKSVPVFWKGIVPEHPGSKDDPTITAGEWVKNLAERFYDGPDPIGKTHVREGVVVRIVNRPKFTAYKHKNFLFKCISGIISEKTADSTTEIAEDILAEL